MIPEVPQQLSWTGVDSLVVVLVVCGVAIALLSAHLPAQSKGDVSAANVAPTHIISFFDQRLLLVAIRWSVLLSSARTSLFGKVVATTDRGHTRVNAHTTLIPVLVAELFGRV